MAKTKQALLKEAKAIGIEVDAKSKVAEIQALIAAAADKSAGTEAPGVEETMAPVEAEAGEAPAAKAGKRSAKALEGPQAR